MDSQTNPPPTNSPPHPIPKQLLGEGSSEIHNLNYCPYSSYLYFPFFLPALVCVLFL